MNKLIFTLITQTSAGRCEWALLLGFHFTYLHVWIVEHILSRSKTVSQPVEAGRQEGRQSDRWAVTVAQSAALSFDSTCERLGAIIELWLLFSQRVARERKTQRERARAEDFSPMNISRTRWQASFVCMIKIGPSSWTISIVVEPNNGWVQTASAVSCPISPVGLQHTVHYPLYILHACIYSTSITVVPSSIHFLCQVWW